MTMKTTVLQTKAYMLPSAISHVYVSRIVYIAFYIWCKRLAYVYYQCTYVIYEHKQKENGSIKPKPVLKSVLHWIFHTTCHCMSFLLLYLSCCIEHSFCSQQRPTSVTLCPGTDSCLGEMKSSNRGKLLFIWWHITCIIVVAVYGMCTME